MHFRLLHPFRFSFFSLTIWLGVLCCIFPVKSLWANGEGFHRSALTGGLRPLLDLHGEWRDEDNRKVKVPFQDLDRETMTVRKTFSLAEFEKLPDTVFLYLEAVAWKSEIWLNEKLLGVSSDPFAEQLLLVCKPWLKPYKNVVEVRMVRGPQHVAYGPAPFIGIFRQAMFLQADTLPAFSVQPEEVQRASRAVMVAPWSMEDGFLNDTIAVLRSLTGLFAYPHSGDPIQFAFQPSAEARALVQRLGRKVLAPGSQADSLSFYNAYPVDPQEGSFSGRFWRDSAGIPTAAYGHYFSHKELEVQALRNPDKVALLIFLLLPVLCMLLLKLIAPKQYAALPEYLTKTKIYLELIASSKFLKDEQRLMINLMRMTFTSVFVSLYIHYINLSGDWTQLNLLSSSSFLAQYFEGSTPTLYQIFLQVWGVVLGLNLLKYLLLNIVGGIFGVYSLSAMTQNLDIFAAFPLNLLPIVPAAVIFFAGVEFGSIVLQVWYVLILVYLLRRFVLIFGGLTKLFQFSTGLKILYICTLEIAPWVFLI